MPKVGVILVNYKTYANRFLEECRDTLRTQDFPSTDLRVYIVDNAASPETDAYLRATYPEAVIIPRADGNYSAANNAGIARARSDGATHLVIANMDTHFTTSWLRELVHALDSDPALGIVQSKVLLYPQTPAEWSAPKINTLGNIMHYLGFGFTSHYQELERPDSSFTHHLIPIDGYASGCSLIIRDNTLDRIGGYDEEYYMYHDDVELSWRAKLAGYKLALAPKSVLYHKYEFGRSIMMLYYMERNRYLVMLTYYKPQTLLLLSPAIIGMELGMWYAAITGGWVNTKWRVTKYFLTPLVWKQILAKRGEVTKLRTVSEHAVLKTFVGEVLFQEIMSPLLKYLVNPCFNFYWRLVLPLIRW